MILAPIQDRKLRLAVRRAALPDEDVFHRSRDVRQALRFGYPRLLVCEARDQAKLREALSLDNADIAVLALTEATIRGWEVAWEVSGLAVSPIDDSALRLRRLMEDSAGKLDWVESIFADLTHTVGRGLPREFRGFSRRILESPFRYSSLSALGEAFGVSGGALKARFRRRNLPSPARYLRWLRLLAAARILSDPEETTFTASYRLGFASDGNFCRWIRATSGMSPSAFRDWKGRLSLVIMMAEDCLREGSLEGWETFGGLFLRQVA